MVYSQSLHVRLSIALLQFASMEGLVWKELAPKLAVCVLLVFLGISVK